MTSTKLCMLYLYFCITYNLIRRPIMNVECNSQKQSHFFFEYSVTNSVFVKLISIWHKRRYVPNCVITISQRISCFRSKHYYTISTYIYKLFFVSLTLLPQNKKTRNSLGGWDDETSECPCWHPKYISKKNKM